MSRSGHYRCFGRSDLSAIAPIATASSAPGWSIKERGWELVPHNWACSPAGGLSTRDGVDMLKLCFDQLHAEGANSDPHVIGQPHRIPAQREFFDYVKTKPGVWMPTREQISTWYLGEAPPT